MSSACPCYQSMSALIGSVFTGAERGRIADPRLRSDGWEELLPVASSASPAAAAARAPSLRTSARSKLVPSPKLTDRPQVDLSRALMPAMGWARPLEAGRPLTLHSFDHHLAS